MVDLLTGQGEVRGDIHKPDLLFQVFHLCEAGVDNINVCIGCERALERPGVDRRKLSPPLFDRLFHELQGVGGIAIDGIQQVPCSRASGRGFRSGHIGPDPARSPRSPSGRPVFLICFAPNDTKVDSISPSKAVFSSTSSHADVVSKSAVQQIDVRTLFRVKVGPQPSRPQPVPTRFFGAPSVGAGSIYPHCPA